MIRFGDGVGKGGRDGGGGGGGPRGQWSPAVGLAVRGMW